MRVLFITDILLTGDLAYTIQEQGNDVRLCILDPTMQECYSGLVPVYLNWREQLEWVGKDGLIIFDDVGHGQEHERLRAAGFTVYGSGTAERLETDRAYGGAVLSQCGFRTVPLHTFQTVAEAYAHVQSHPAEWVIKFQDGHWLKPYAYVGDESDGSDVLAVLENYQRNNTTRSHPVTLQERVRGVEIGVARYFNGQQFVGPIEYNVEHTRLFPGDLGPVVDEMGTLAWYSERESEKLYQDTLARLEDHLRLVDFRGNIDVNCIVNQGGVYPLEFTARLGAPIVYLHKIFHVSPWAEWCTAIARSEPYDLKWNPGFGVVVSGVIPPFPYRNHHIGASIIGTKIRFHDESYYTQGHVHFDEVASHGEGPFDLYVAGKNGYVCYATGLGQTIEQAHAQAMAAMKSVNVPRLFYRADISTRFANTSYAELQSWGYLLDDVQVQQHAPRGNYEYAQKFLR